MSVETAVAKAGLSLVIADTYNQFGETEARYENYTKAIEQFEAATRANPNHARAFYNWARILKIVGAYAEAVEKYRQAIELNEQYLDPENVSPDVAGDQDGQKAAIEDRQEATKNNAAIEDLEEAIKNYANAYVQWGNALFEADKNSEACEKYQKATEINPQNAQAFNNWATALSVQKKYPEAIEKAKKAIEVDPKYARPYTTWGKVLFYQGKYAEAAEKCQQSIEIDLTEQGPMMGNTYHTWGDALYSLGKYAEAAEKYQKTAELAAEKYQATAELDPDLAPAYYNWGQALAAEKKHPEAIAKYQKATEIDPNYASAYVSWGVSLGKQFHYDAAVEKFQMAARAKPDNTSSYHNLAYYLWMQGKYESGRDAWEKARRVYERTKESAKENGNAEHFYYYGSVLFEVFGELKEAEKVFAEGLELDPHHTDILVNMVDLYLEKKEAQPEKEVSDPSERAVMHWKARECYRKAEQLLRARITEKEDSLVLLQLGELLLKMEEPAALQDDKYAQAEKHFWRALELDQESSASCNNLGVVYTRREDFKRAVQYFELALSRAPDNLNTWSNLAEVYLKSKQREKAEAEYMKILGITQGHIESQFGLGEVYSAMGDDGDPDMYEKAVKFFTAGISLAEGKKGSKRLKANELAAPFYSRGYARVKLYESSKPVGDDKLLQEAQNDFERCCRLDPDNHKARRAIVTLKKKRKWFSPQRFNEKIGPWVILVPAFAILVLSQASFFFRWPVKDISMPFYSTSTFGAFIFIVVGLYLPQILKLKVAGIELEKSVVEQVSTSVSLGITR